jgi:hypothetical protein
MGGSFVALFALRRSYPDYMFTGQTSWYAHMDRPDRAGYRRGARSSWPAFGYPPLIVDAQDDHPHLMQLRSRLPSV